MKSNITPYCAIYDEVLPLEYQEKIKDIIASKKLKWQVCDYSVDPDTQKNNGGENCQEYPQLSSTVVDWGIGEGVFVNEIAEILKLFLESINATCSKVFRIKINIQEKAENYGEDKYLTPHVDMNLMHNVLIYYPIDSDGDTLLFEKTDATWKIVERVQPKQGRFLLFSGDQHHSARPPTISESRIVINFDFL
jgi:hypothetical protein